jgi:uncharacterized protein YqcC (DUF446 family)
MIRRKPQLISDPEPERVWCLALADGTVRESLNHLHVRAIVETGVATADSHILRLGETTWHRLGDHPLWATVAPRASAVNSTQPVAADPGVQAQDVRAVTPRMQALWQEQREVTQAKLQASAVDEDLGRLLQSLGLACGVIGLICLGDIIVFTCSIGIAFMLLVAFVRLLSLWLIWRILR